MRKKDDLLLAEAYNRVFEMMNLQDLAGDPDVDESHMTSYGEYKGIIDLNGRYWKVTKWEASPHDSGAVRVIAAHEIDQDGNPLLDDESDYIEADPDTLVELADWIRSNF